jgi:tetratricopeptide (TPR) repeat protein/S1-C subfamily serine protease
MKKIAILLSTLLLSQTSFNSTQAQPDNSVTSRHQIAQANDDGFILSPQQVQQTAKNITVRITSANNGGSGVLIAKKGNTYLVLTNAHVTRRTAQFQIQAPDGQKYTAKPIDGGFDPKYDLALLQFTSKTKYTLADLSDVNSPLAAERTIYSAGFPFDSKDIRITSGAVSQLSDIPFDNGTQIGYTTNKGEKGIRQGMSGGAILDARGNFLGINTLGVAPILPNYTYNDGSKPLARLAARYREANWSVPVYNFLIKVKPDILYGYKFKGLEVGKIQRQATLTGYMAKLNDTARKQTVRIENSGGNGSGVIVAREGNSYYVVTAKHVVESDKTQKKFTNHKLITYDQDTHALTSTVVATGVDLAVVKFSSNNNYPIAQLSESIPNTNEIVLAGGFPGRDKINSPLWQWQLNPGYVYDREEGKLQTQTKQSFENGYDIIYSSISYGGMSGGTVFDTSGRVIGIHGKAERTNGTILGNSQGISMQTLIGLAEQLQLNPKLLQIAKTPASTLTALDLQTIETAMQNLTKPNPEDNGERWLTYGNQLYRTRQYEKSVRAFDTAITKGQILTGNYAKALSLRSLGKYDLAQSAIAKAIETVPPKNRAEYYYFWKHKSVIFSSQEKYALALQSSDIAIKLQPQDRTLLNQKADILSSQKQYAAAIKIFNNMIRYGEEAYVYIGRGLVKSELGDKQSAISDYNRAIKLNPNFAGAYYNRGLVKSELGDKQSAISDYNRAIKLHSNFTDAYIGRGITRSELGDKHGATSDFNRAIKINSNYANAYYNRGVTKSEIGDRQGALSDYNLAIKINPNDARAYYNRGVTKSELRDKQGALSDLSNAAKLFHQQGQIDLYQRAMKAIAELKGN